MFKRTPIPVLAALVALTSLAGANGFNLGGLGTRAQSMGGAFVGIADDFSAVFWNPAGAAGFKQTVFGFNAFDLVPRATYRMEVDISLDYPEGIDAKTETTHYLGGLAGYYKPLSSKVVVGLGIGTPSGQGLVWDGEDFQGDFDAAAYERSVKVGMFSFSPLISVRFSEKLSVGATFNLNYGMFERKMPVFAYVLEGQGQYEENLNGWGVGATFGVLWKPVDKLGVGLTVRTPSTVTFKGTASMYALSLLELPESSELTRKITWPLWIAGGVSFRPVPRLLLSADVHWTQWSKLERFTSDYADSFWVTLMQQAGLEGEYLHWEDAFQFRFGAEFLLNATTALRAGYYNDQAPGPVEPMNVLLPTHTFNVFTAGVGKTVGDLQLDFGLQYFAGNQRTGEWIFETPTSTYGMNIVVPTVSVSYKF
jgi:long-chain fatty acid transport protein